MVELMVDESFEIRVRGAAVFFVTDPAPTLPWCPHRVRVLPPSGEIFEIVADVEFALKHPPSEVMSLVFKGLEASQVPKGSKVTILAAIEAPDGDVT